MFTPIVSYRVKVVAYNYVCNYTQESVCVQHVVPFPSHLHIFPSREGPARALPTNPKGSPPVSGTVVSTASARGSKNAPPAGKADVVRRPVYRRNVFKSILRNMIKFANRNYTSLIKRLARRGYVQQEIDRALFIVNNYRRVDGRRDDRDKYKKVLDSVAAEKSILAFIFKDSLQCRIDKLKSGSHGKITKDNLAIYKRMYGEYYNRVAATLEEAETNIQTGPEGDNTHDKKPKLLESRFRI